MLQTEINECDSAPCYHNAYCIDGDASFECNCTAGYQGELCTDVTQLCQPDTCMNGGTCYDVFNSLFCLLASCFAFLLVGLYKFDVWSQTWDDIMESWNRFWTGLVSNSLSTLRSRLDLPGLFLTWFWRVWFYRIELAMQCGQGNRARIDSVWPAQAHKWSTSGNVQFAQTMRS